MTPKRRSRQRKRATGTLLEKGIAVTAIGIGLLVAPFIVGGSPMLHAIAGGMRMAAWPALLSGVALLAIHFFVRHKGQAPAAAALQAKPPGNAALRRDAAVASPPPAPGNARPGGEAAPNGRPGTVPQPATNWGPAVFSAIEWRRFEAVCEALFTQAGFQTRSQSHGADGGVDIWLHSRNADGLVAVVQCKNWLSKPVGVKELREFFGVMTANGLKRGTYATSGRYTADAAQFAKDNGINALDGKGLLGLIARSSPEQQRNLLQIAYEGEYWRPTCASCGVKMVERTPASGDALFWGCANFPRCRSTLPMRQAN